MRKFWARFNHDPIVTFLLLWAIVFGAVVRLAPVIAGDFPLNDGGLFYVMVEDLKASHYRLPMYTTYNAAQIPYAYPPLPFYLAAALSDVFHIPLLQIFRWLPAFLSILPIPAFYFLSKRLLQSPLQAALATIAFAMLPRTYDWLVTGGGHPRGLGMLFSILTLYSIHALLANRRAKHAVLTVLFGTLLVLSHPEAALHTVFSAGVLVLFFGRTKVSIVRALSIAFGVLLLSAPWWATIVSRHGWSPFLSALRTGWYSWFFWTPILTLNISSELFLTVVAILGLSGLVACVIKKDYLLPAWLAVPFLVEPRIAETYATLPLAMLASIGLSRVVLPGLMIAERETDSMFGSDDLRTDGPAILRSISTRIALAFFLVYTLVNAIGYTLYISPVRVSADERAALHWINGNTPEGSRFLALTYGDALNTPVQEWFPALSERVCLTTVQGYEWLPAGQFDHRKEVDFPELQRCLFEDRQCIEEWAREREYEFEYVYIYQKIVGNTDPETQNLILGQWLIHSLEDSPDYSLVYNTRDMCIFAHTTVSSRTP